VIQSAASGLRTSLQNDISSANSAIQTAIDAINAANPFGDITAPQIPVPNLDALQNVTLPASFEQTLTDLNNTLPTFDDLKQKIESVCVTNFYLFRNSTFSCTIVIGWTLHLNCSRRTLMTHLLLFHSILLPFPSRSETLYPSAAKWICLSLTTLGMTLSISPRLGR
jgi:hypothetical protein